MKYEMFVVVPFNFGIVYTIPDLILFTIRYLCQNNDAAKLLLFFKYQSTITTIFQITFYISHKNLDERDW